MPRGPPRRTRSRLVERLANQKANAECGEVTAVTRVAVARKRNIVAFKPETPNAELEFRVYELREALEKIHYTDAHLVTYLVEDAEKQPRITKEGLELFRATYRKRVTVECFFCDVDNPGHGPWTDELYGEAGVLDASLEILSTAGIYYTKNGRRIVQPLAKPLEVEDVEPYLFHWLRRLQDAGLNADLGCKDWTHVFRLPRVRRDGALERRYIDLSRMRPIELPPVPPEIVEEMKASSRRKSSKGKRVAVRPAVAVVPKYWMPIVAPVAEAVAKVMTPWHALFLALAGAMLRLGIPPENVAALNEAISSATHADDRTEDRVNCARSTVEHYSRGDAFTGLTTLRTEWPEVARALESAVEAVRLTGAAGPQPKVTETRSLSEITAALEAAIDQAPPGLTVIKAECGLGKTQAALRVAARRAAKPYVSANAAGLRAPANSKTAVSVDKNKLAIQCMTEVKCLGQSSNRLFGPLSLLDADGVPVCRFHQVAAPLVAGGQRMQWELCERRNDESKCPHYDACPARSGQEGSEQARITLGTHSLLGALDAEAGATGLLVIDEVPEFLETALLDADELEVALRSASTSFEPTYVAALTPVLWAWLGFLEQAPESEIVDACEAVRRFAHCIPPPALVSAQRSAQLPSDADAVDCAENAPFPAKHCGTAPPILKHRVDFAVHNQSEASQLGRISTVLKTAHHAMSSDYPVVVRIESIAGARHLLVTSPREMLARALRRDGAVVVTDANADLHLPILAKVVGYEPPMRVFTAPDGAPIQRTMIRTRKATRKEWLDRGKLDLDSSLVELVRTAFEWVKEAPATNLVGVITIPLVECVLKHAAGIDTERCLQDWKSMGQSRSALDAFSEALAPALAPWRGKLLTAHYGATRGLNDMAQADALITLGDPWTNLGDARSDAAFLQLEAEWEARYVARCRAELEQAHGRLRTVHRTRPGRALHVGTVMPGGSGWVIGKVEVRERTSTSNATTSESEDTIKTMPPDEFAREVGFLGGVRAAARMLGCSPGAVMNYRDGKRAIPSALAGRMRRAT